VVVVCGAVTYRWFHAGPSGFPLQSKVNDVLMDVLIDRVLSRREEGRDMEWWDTLINSVGSDLGFSVRVEQFARLKAKSLVGFLEQRPFLFVGFYFHVREGEVQVCIDMPRAMAQMPYPGLKWIKTDKDLKILEAMRLGSQLLGAGLPPVELDEAFSAWRTGVCELLEQAIELAGGDAQDERLKWAVGAGMFGPEATPSLTGLLAALKRDPHELWMEKEKELPTESYLLHPPAGATWADTVEWEEAEWLRRLGRTDPIPALLPPPHGWVSQPPPTHPTTVRNHGRNPPTARWGPNKPPRLHPSPGAGKMKKRGGRRARGMKGAEIWVEASSESSDAYDWSSDE